jgi:hypothetical protein
VLVLSATHVCVSFIGTDLVLCACVRESPRIIITSSILYNYHYYILILPLMLYYACVNLLFCRSVAIWASRTLRYRSMCSWVRLAPTLCARKNASFIHNVKTMAIIMIIIWLINNDMYGWFLTVRTQKYGFFFLPKTELKNPFRKTVSVLCPSRACLGPSSCLSRACLGQSSDFLQISI